MTRAPAARRGRRTAPTRLRRRAGTEPGGAYGPAPGYQYQPGASFGSPAAGSPYDRERAESGRRRFGAGTLVAGMVLAALVGGGAAAGTSALMTPTASQSTSQGATSATTIVNNTDSVNAVTAAAEKASPSTVTISVNGSSESGTGSGVVLDDQGHILTNTHVVTLDGATSSATVEVQFSDGTARTAQVVGTDPTSDLAVIKVDPSGLSLTPATLGDSSKLNVGDIAVAIGAPLGLSGTVTDGIVSNLSRTISVASSAAPEGDSTDSSQGSQGAEGNSPFRFQFPDQDGGTGGAQSQSTIALNVLQTDAAINPGNSGGALVNADGEVIGINVAIASAGSESSTSSASGNIGVGFAIPIDYAQRIAQDIIDDGSAQHGYLGATVSSHAAGDSQSFSDGAEVRSVVGGSPASDAGLKSGDVVTSVNGRRVTDAEGMTATIRESSPGDKISIAYTRGGAQKTAEVTLGNSDDAGQ
ncbi:trypsin-like peptidase domain-containing protein [Rothia sp. AR01]|uniref:Trypsin-like peptidase domain-containing protein n=1 Tax=Rothia santali TaxID=2949643 RepID=A0A9X2HDZ7_9MICC|nr:trypsin-like peptidase domain-containing protein [Rothia santali]MCP3426525.1 trypsin-like peptidase domain-containing protein [Rothia santali]